MSSRIQIARIRLSMALLRRKAAFLRLVIASLNWFTLKSRFMATLSPHSRRRKLWIVAGLLMLAPLIYVGALGFWLQNWGNADRAQKADAIMIFGSGVRSDGRASPTLRARTRHAYELWKRGLAPKILCTGGLGAYPPTESLVQESLLLGWGVPDAAIIKEEKSTSTWENAKFGAPLLPPGSSVIVVSDPYHLWRCRRDCKAFGLTAYVSPALAAWRQWPVRTRLFFCVREAALVTRDLIYGILGI